MDIESKLNDVTVTAISSSSLINKLQQQQLQQHQLQLQQQQQQQQQHQHQQQQQQQQIQQQHHQMQQQMIGQLSPSVNNLVSTTRVSADITTPMTSVNNMQSSNNSSLSKYAQLLAVIEEMGRDLRPTYSGSRSSAERLKRGIVHARILVRECLLETERSARQ